MSQQLKEELAKLQQLFDEKCQEVYDVKKNNSLYSKLLQQEFKHFHDYIEMLEEEKQNLKEEIEKLKKPQIMRKTFIGVCAVMLVIAIWKGFDPNFEFIYM